MHNNINNMLIILGAGASKSLAPRQEDGKERLSFIGIGQGADYPTAIQLVEQIANYQTKSLAWLTAYSY